MDFAILAGIIHKYIGCHISFHSPCSQSNYLVLKKIVCIVLALHGVKVGCMEGMWTWSVNVSAFCEGVKGVGEC